MISLSHDNARAALFAAGVGLPSIPIITSLIFGTRSLMVVLAVVASAAVIAASTMLVKGRFGQLINSSDSSTNLCFRHIATVKHPFVVIAVIPTIIAAVTNSIPYLNVVVIVLWLVGIGLVSLATDQFFQSGDGTTEVPDRANKLIIGGPYQYVRNPHVLGRYTALRI
jgi:hypothetical protein